MARRRSRGGLTRPDDGRWLDHGLLLVTLAALAGGYQTVLTGTSWWLAVVGVCSAVLGASAAVRTLGWRGAPLAGLGAGLVVLSWICASNTMLLGVVPTPATVVGLSQLIDRAGVIVMEQAPPVEATGPITFLLAAAVGLVAVASDVLLRRRGGLLLVGLLLVVLYLVPAVVVEETPAFVVLAVPAAAWLVLLHRSGRNASEPSRRADGSARPWVSTSATLLGISALVAAAALPPFLPDTSALTGTAGDLERGPFERGINPILTLGDDLRSPSTAVALEYTTDGPPPYLSVAMLRDFTGRSWEPVERDPSAPAEGRDDLADEIAVERQVVEIEVGALRSSMLPVPYPAVDVRGLEGDWVGNRAGLTLQSETSDSRDQTYAVTSLVRQPTPEQLAAAPETSPRRLAPYLELPDAVPDSVTETARAVAGDAVGAYAKAQALQDYFRSGAFEYSESAPVEGDYDGNGVAVLARFLEERSGYCVHFSSAMAVMARTLGVPARIMVGYAPGSLLPPDDGSSGADERYRVTTDQLHAWPQIYVEGVGWIGFEPTPGISGGDVAPDPIATTAAPTPTATAAQPDQPVPEATRGAEQDLTAPPTAAPERTADWPRTALALMVTALVLLVGPGLVRLGVRRWRLRGSTSTDAAWREVVATADDLGIVSDETSTIGALVDTVAAQVDSRAGAALQRLRGELEQQRYGPPGTTVVGDVDARADAAEVVAALLTAAPAGRRRRARVLPRSVLRRP